jgi:hypothetical protein
MTPLVHDIRDYIAHAASLPSDQNKAEVRIYAALLTIAFISFLMGEPLIYLLSVPDAMIIRVASLAPSQWSIVAAFAICLFVTIPHLCSLLFAPGSLSSRWPRRFATYGGIGCAVTWIYLGNLAIPLDTGSLEIGYFLRSAFSLLMAGAYAFSMNAQQGREILNAPQD